MVSFWGFKTYQLNHASEEKAEGRRELLNTPRPFWSSPVTWLGDFVSQNHTDHSLMVKCQNGNASTGLGGE